MNECEVTRSCPTVCNPMECSLPGSSVHGILQARILEWVTISFSRGSSQSRDQTWVSRIGGRQKDMLVSVHLFKWCTDSLTRRLETHLGCCSASNQLVWPQENYLTSLHSIYSFVSEGVCLKCFFKLSNYVLFLFSKREKNKDFIKAIGTRAHANTNMHTHIVFKIIPIIMPVSSICWNAVGKRSQGALFLSSSAEGLSPECPG